MKAISFIKKHATVMLAGAAIIGFSSFKVIKLNNENKDTDLIFTYVPPAGSPAPYSDTKILQIGRGVLPAAQIRKTRMSLVQLPYHLPAR